MRLAALTGRLDLSPVMHEPFRQWVIEDDFRAGRPDWDKAGATFTPDVHAVLAEYWPRIDTVVMGRKTWDSLPVKPLPGRLNIVLSNDGSFEPAFHLQLR
mgnify:CR=1 FL=1